MKGSKADYRQIGVRISPEDFKSLRSYYSSHGLLNKVVRVLISRHLRKLAAQDALAASEVVSSSEVLSLTGLAEGER